ncbi:MAG: Xylulose kinase [Acinetobacter bereziniae]|uniref:Xylulose kinase n=1 Tax=Acinetobacter bereziniae TaxID=106648 RepID=A0A833PAF2_ACIBZ|nr:MAG: Xylulose kinase [Acinetobacter bereziniae]
MQVLLGIDIGTSGCKDLLIDTEGNVIAADTATYPLSKLRPGWVEQDPELWIEGASQAVAGVLAKVSNIEILSVGLSGQMHGLVPLDAAHQVLRPAILWNDQRNRDECVEIVEAAGGLDGLLAETNNRMLVGYTGGKILWMRHHEPELFSQIKVVLNPKDYLRLRLTGEIATEVSDASGTGLFNVRSRQWATGLIEKIAIDPCILPPVFESQVISGRVSAQGAKRFGIPVGVPVAGGGGDSVIQTFGSGVIAPGELQTTLGTAGILATALDHPKHNPDGRLQIFCNIASDKWHCMGVSLNAGGAMSWFRDTFYLGTEIQPLSFEQIVEQALTSIADARGLLFLPYLYGERCPHPDPTARAALIGMTARHHYGDIARAVMEGIVYALVDMYGLMQPLNIEGHLIKASGGGAKAKLWRQIQADVFGCPVVTTNGAAEGAAFGAALVAGLAVGVWDDAESAIKNFSHMTCEQPNQMATTTYSQLYRLYRDLYPVLGQTFAALGSTQFDQ